MKRKRTSTILCLLCCLLGSSLAALAGPSKPSAGQALPSAVQATILAVLNVRSGPGTTFPVLGQLAVGATVAVTGRTAEGRELWWQITYPDSNTQRAWIIGRADLVQMNNGASVPVVAAPIAPTPPNQSSNTPAPQLTLHIARPGDELRMTRFSPDGSQFATASGNLASFGVKLWRTSDGAHLRDFTDYRGIVWDLAFSPDGRWLATVADDPAGQSLQVWQVADGKLVKQFGIPTSAALFYSVAFSPDGRALAVGGVRNQGFQGIDGATWLLNTNTWQVNQLFPVFGQNATTIAFSPDGRLLVTGGAPDGKVYVWRLSDSRVLQSLSVGRVGVRRLALSPNGALLAIAFCDEAGSYGCVKGGVTIIRLNDGGEIARFPDVAESVAFSPDGRFLVTGAGANDANLRIRSTADWALLQTLPGATYGVVFSPDGRYLAANDFDKVQVWTFNAAATPSISNRTAPQVLAFTVTPTTTRNLGDPMTLTWAATGERAELCRLVVTQLSCEAVPLQGQKTIHADQTLLGVSAFVLQAMVGDQKITSAVYIYPQCQSRYRWFFGNPPTACPAAAATSSLAAFQRFEHGLMLWVEHEPGQADDEFYVFFDETPRTYVILAAPFRLKPGASRDNRSSEPPPTALFEPISGFGMLWRDEFETDPFYFHDLRARLGWALAAEEGYELVRQCTAQVYPSCYLRLPDNRVLRTYPDSTAGVRQLWEEWPGR